MSIRRSTGAFKSMQNKRAMLAACLHICCGGELDFDAAAFWLRSALKPFRAQTLACRNPSLPQTFPVANRQGRWTEETGESWCSDCRVADPVIEETFKNFPCTIITCPVGPRSSYGVGVASKGEAETAN